MHWDAEMLARVQFALTAMFHYLYPPLTIGLAWLMVIMEARHLKTGQAVYESMAKFWTRIFAATFAMGVTTGIVMEFEFGTNWAAYSRFVGDVFGSPLAAEALLSFFLESTFLGVLVFGWERISKKLHAAVMWIVAIGGNLSAFWILAANGFMQHPVGYEIVNGRAQMTDFGALLGNPRALYLFLHTFFAGLVTAAFFVLGFSIYHLVRNHEVEAFKKSFYLSALIGLISAVAVGLAGHAQGVYLRVVQPMAAAASEAHYETADPADFHLIAGIDQEGRRTTWSITIPKALSFLYFFRFSGEVEGLNNIQAQYEALYGPGNYIPNIPLAFWSFRAMVGVGTLMVLLTAGALIIAWKKYPDKWIKRSGWLVWIIFLPYIANTTGWILTETGRQPWMVHGLMQTKDAVSPNLTPATVLISLVGFVAIYAVLMAFDLFLLLKYAKKGLVTVEADSVPIAAVEAPKKRGGK